ncbi:lytic transglycosylase domain-containing protein [Desulfococcaceae bacterium HSG8]|nr:lytic transglycosylase domain-containing protein [Desulfococcaceae bacterium HSG8]
MISFRDKKLSVRFFCVFFILFVVGSTKADTSDIYVYVDKNGIRHFTNVPTSSNYRVFLKSRSSGYYSYSASPGTYDHYIKRAAEKYGVEFPLVKAVIKVESNFNPKAVSRKGAQGLMQLMPGTADLLNVGNPFNPRENIEGGTRYLRMMMDRFGGKLKLALAGYNAGPERVARHKGIPPIRETRNYVKKVMGYYRVLSKK